MSRFEFLVPRIGDIGQWVALDLHALDIYITGPTHSGAAMLKMRAMIVPEPGGRFRMEERDLPEPGRHEVRIRVHACGVCHSDSFVVDGHMPGLSYHAFPAMK
jgi:Alcohol dehydrogenase GroES-like domain